MLQIKHGHEHREREIDRLKGLKYNWMNGERERYWGDGQTYTESFPSANRDNYQLADR